MVVLYVPDLRSIIWSGPWILLIILGSLFYTGRIHIGLTTRGKIDATDYWNYYLLAIAAMSIAVVLATILTPERDEWIGSKKHQKRR